MTITIGIMGLFWLISVACSACAILLLVVRRSPLWGVIMTMEAVAMIIGFMGFTGWTPFGHLPDVAYSWSNGSFMISMRLGSLYLVPLILAAIGTLIIRKTRAAAAKHGLH